jgi:hypothetical protein
MWASAASFGWGPAIRLCIMTNWEIAETLELSLDVFKTCAMSKMLLSFAMQSRTLEQKGVQWAF